MGQFRILGSEGDVKQIWNPDNLDEVAAARKTFTDLKAKGHRAYAVTDVKGKKGEMITEFDPKAGKIILAPPMQGG